MRNKPIPVKWITLCLAGLLVAQGCAHEIRRYPTSSEYPTQTLTRPEGLEERIQNLQALLDEDRLGPEDRLLAQDLLKTYAAFDKASLRPVDEQGLRLLVELLFSNLAQMEDRTFRIPHPDAVEEVGDMALLAEKRKRIMTSYLSGDYKSVIEGVAQMEKSFGTHSLSPDIGLVLALSLARRGMVQEALRLGSEISEDVDRAPGLIELRARMVEWQLALGDRQGAVRSYEKLVDNMQETEAFIKGAERNISGQGLQQALIEKREEPALSIDFSREPASLQEALNRVDALVRNNDFASAKLLLLRLSIRLQAGPEADLVEQAMKSVELAEERSWDQESSDAFQRREALELAANLIEQEKYEEAVVPIDSRSWGKELGTEAKQLQDLAVEKIVNRERDQAARLFFMARNTQDPARKESFLIDSRNILKALLEKYPSTPLSKRINDNIKRVEEELSKVKGSS
jgi:hypothetical protein